MPQELRNKSSRFFAKETHVKLAKNAKNKTYIDYAGGGGGTSNGTVLNRNCAGTITITRTTSPATVLSRNCAGAITIGA